jgi:hypothetical protein
MGFPNISSLYFEGVSQWEKDYTGLKLKIGIKRIVIILEPSIMEALNEIIN